MRQQWTGARAVVSLAGAALVGVLGLQAWPFPATDPILGLVAVHRPALYRMLLYGYATVWFSTPFVVLQALASLVFIYGRGSRRPAFSAALPPYPYPATRDNLCLVLGEQHQRSVPEPAPQPQWLVIPEAGLYSGMAIVGAVGTGKTSSCIYPYVEQLLAYRAQDPVRKVGGLILDVKGDFARHVQVILDRHGRGADYIEVSLDGPYRYNPLHNDLEAYTLAFGIATLLTNLYGRGKEPFWQQASTNLVKFVILLHQVLDNYVTLVQVYEHVINPDKLRAKVADGEVRFAVTRRIRLDQRVLLAGTLNAWTWNKEPSGTACVTEWSHELVGRLTALGITYEEVVVDRSAAEADRAARFEAVKRWFDDDWMRIEPKLRTSIVEGISVFLSLFDDNPRVKYTFCAPKAVYEATAAPSEGHGTPLPPMAELLEQGRVVVLNFPLATNPGLARAVGTMLKQDFQRAVLNRIPQMSAHPQRPWRPVAFVCDEYQTYATTGEHEPSGDEKFFSLARQARCIPIVATQSISSLRSTLPGESWRALLQGLRTKIFLALSDDVSAHYAAELCGKAERLRPGYTLTEGGQDASVSWLTGRAVTSRSTVSAAKTYSLAVDYVFRPKVFAELRNGQAVVLPYDGEHPQPPTYCYLKPYFRDPQIGYFDERQRGAT